MSRIIIFFLLLFSYFLNAQQVSIKGKIVDKMNGEAIEYATITLHSPTDSSLNYWHDRFSIYGKTAS